MDGSHLSFWGCLGRQSAFKRLRLSQFGLLSALVLCSTLPAGARTITVTLNTSTLLSDLADQPFALEFELENGKLAVSGSGGTSSPSNQVIFSNFNFGGGTFADPATDPAFLAEGGASGSIGNTVTLEGTSASNYLSQSFTPGSTLSFQINYTNNVSGAAIPDIFDFGIVDSNYSEIPTNGGEIFDSFLEIQFTSGTPTVVTYASNPAAFTSADVSLSLPAPSVGSAVPEPSSWLLLASALILLTLRKRLMILKTLSQRLQRIVPFAAALFLVAQTGALKAQDAPVEYYQGIYNGKPVTYQIINGFAVTEGDIVIGTATPGTGRGLHTLRPESNSVNQPSKLWPKVGGVVTVPYTIINGNASVAPTIAAFNALFPGQIRWVQRTNERNYVEINLNNQSGNSCFASLGYSPGKTILQGSNTCDVPVLLHEMGHNMGFAHEQSRADRASWLNIDFSNIQFSQQSQYTQDLNSTMNLGLYDYASIMHYGPRGFTRNGNPEMESIPAGLVFGSAPNYSVGDRDAINRLYLTAPTSVTITTNPAGLQVIVDGSTITAPQTFAWALNSTHTLGVPTGPQTVGGSNYVFGRWNSDLTGDLNPSRTITIAPGNGTFGNPASSPAATVYAANFQRLWQVTPVILLDNNLPSDPATAGAVSLTPAPSSFPGLTGQFYAGRPNVTLTATPAGTNSFYGFFNRGVQAFGQAINPLTVPVDAVNAIPDQQFLVYFASQPVVTVTTSLTNNASNATVVADGAGSKSIPASWALANDAGWGAGTNHTLAVNSPVSPVFDTAIQYVFSSWSDGVTTATRNVTVPASGVLSLGVTYSTNYQVIASANSACAGSVAVSPTQAGSFVASGTPLTFTATPTAPFIFAGWGGTLSGTTNPVNSNTMQEVNAVGNFNLVATPLTITSVSPASLPAGSPAQNVTLKGTGFTQSSTIVFYNLTSRTATYVDANTMTVALTAADLANAGTAAFLAENQANGCSIQTPGQLSFNVSSPAL